MLTVKHFGCHLCDDEDETVAYVYSVAGGLTCHLWDVPWQCDKEALAIESKTYTSFEELTEAVERWVVFLKENVR